MLTKQHKNTVKSIIRRNGQWTGYIVGCKINPYHVANGWYLGYKVTINSLDELEKVINEWTYYNANDVFGDYPAFYVIG